MKKEDNKGYTKLQSDFSRENILDFFTDKERAFHHTSYYTYSSLENIDNILCGGTIWLTWLGESTTNDTVDSEYYKDKQNLFSVCFSTGTSETLPLWYLYSGIDGKGARLEMPKKWFKSLAELDSVELVSFQKDNPKNVIAQTKVKKGDFEVKIHDILYIGKDSRNEGTYRIKYNGQALNNRSKDDYIFLTNSYGGFYKGLIWFYEKETRIQIAINEELLTPGTSYRLEIPIENYMNKINVRVGPEMTAESMEELLKMKGYKKFMQKKIEKSDYEGTIKMGLKRKLCKNCPNKNKENSK